ncbi:unnamed protein product, partial [Brassica rapa]
DEAAPAVVVPLVVEPSAIPEDMDLLTALELTLRKARAHGGVVRGLHECAKLIEKRSAQLCVLAEDCNQPDYVKLVKALCADHNINLLTVPNAKTLGEWAGLCKIDSEVNASKVVGCLCLVVTGKSLLLFFSVSRCDWHVFGDLFVMLLPLNTSFKHLSM